MGRKKKQPPPQPTAPVEDVYAEAKAADPGLQQAAERLGKMMAIRDARKKKNKKAKEEEKEEKEATHVKRQRRRCRQMNKAIVRKIRKTQATDHGTCVRKKGFTRLIRQIARDSAGDWIQLKGKAVKALQTIVEDATVHILQQAYQRRIENGGKQLLAKNLCNAFLDWNAEQRLDFLEDMKFTMKKTGMDFTERLHGVDLGESAAFA